MKNHYRFVRKSYAMQRMANAIERAIHAATSAEKERAARWAAAWGLLCGIITPTSRLRPSDVGTGACAPASTPRSCVQIQIPPLAATAPPPASSITDRPPGAARHAPAAPTQADSAPPAEQHAAPRPTHRSKQHEQQPPSNAPARAAARAR